MCRVGSRKEKNVLMRLCGAYISYVVSRQILQSGCRIQTTGFLKSFCSENDQQLPSPLLILLKINEAVTRIFHSKASTIEGERWKNIQCWDYFECSCWFIEIISFRPVIDFWKRLISSTVPRTNEVFAAFRLLSPSHSGFSFRAHFSSQFVSESRLWFLFMRVHVFEFKNYTLVLKYDFRPASWHIHGLLKLANAHAGIKRLVCLT